MRFVSLLTHNVVELINICRFAMVHVVSRVHQEW